MKISLLNLPVVLILQVFSSLSLCVKEVSASPIDTPSVLWSSYVEYPTRMSAISADGRRVLYSDGIGSSLGRAMVIDVQAGSAIARFDVNVDTNHQGRDAIKSMHFLNDTSFMVVTQISFYVMDSRTGKLIEDVGRPSTGSGIKYVVPMYNTDKMIIGAYRSLYKYDYKTKQMDTIYRSRNNGADGHTGDIGWIGLSDDERTVYSAGNYDSEGPSRLCAWELATGRQIYQVDEPDSTRFNVVSKPTHGSFLAAANSLGSAYTGFAEVYDLRTGAIVARYRDVAIETQGVGVSRDGAVVGIQGDGRVDFYTTKEPHLFASMKAWPAFDIRFLDNDASDVLIGQVDSLVQRVRLNLSTSVNGDAAPQVFYCNISPNPSNSQVTLQIVLASPAIVSVRLSATDGRVVSERSLGLLQSGTHSEVLQAEPGYYMCTVTAGSGKQSLLVIIR